MMSFGAFGNSGNQPFKPPTTGTIFTPATAQPPQQQQQQTTTSTLSQLSTQQPIDHTTHPFERLRAAYDPNSANCPFRCFFYNRLPPNTNVQSDNIIKPPQVSERLWQQVVDDNPKPGHYIPVMATGFQDLSERAKWQDATLTAHSAKLAELESRLEGMLKGHESNSDEKSIFRKLSAALQRQNQLALRVIKIMRQIEVLRRAGRRLSENEQEMLKLLQLLNKKLSTSPIDPTSIRVFAFQLKALTDEQKHTETPNQPTLSEPFISALLPLLADQQNVLSELVESVNSALTDYDIMMHGYQV